MNETEFRRRHRHKVLRFLCALVPLWLCLLSSTTVEKALQIRPFMRNKPNFRKSQMNITKEITKDYENKTLGGRGKNKANSKPNKPNLQKAQINVNKVLTKDYENKSNWAIYENKPNTNPIQTQTKPISPPHAAKQTQYKANTNPIKPNLLNAQMNVNKVLTKHYENARLRGRGKNKPNQTQSEILNQKSQIHSHPAGNKLHTPRRQSWGCFDLSGRATPKTAGLGFSLVALELIRITGSL